MINIFGVIGVDVTFVDVMDEITAEKGDKIEVLIYSPGGSLREGLAIYDALKADSRPIHTTILGLGASSASAIFCAGDDGHRLVGDASEFMIHNVLVPPVVGGNKYELIEIAQDLDEEDQKLISIYESVTNLSREEIEAMMKIETKLDADKAIELGFASGKANTMAMVAQFNIKNKESNMATDEKDEKGFFAMCKAFFSNEAPEAVAEEVKAEDDEEMKAEDEAPQEEESEAKAEGEEEEAEEEAQADSEVEALKAEIVQLKSDLEAKHKAEFIAKKDQVFEAIADNKLTFSEAKNLMDESSEVVTEKLKGLEANATGYGRKDGDLSNKPVECVLAKYEALSGSEKTKHFNAHKEEIIEKLNKETK